MSRWTDPETLRNWRAGGWSMGTLGRALRQVKRLEAEERNARTPRDRRRFHREGAPAGRSTPKETR